MAQQPQASLDVPPAQKPLRYMSELSIGFNFQPDGRCLVANFLAPKALRGRVPDDLVQDAVADGVDVYGTLPEALPFHRCNRGEYGKVWGHFFTTRPAAASASGGGDVRDALGGCWRKYGGEKAYAGEDGDVVAFRSRFAFYDGREGGDKPTPWRMKEFRINEGAAAFRGVAFHPVAKGLVVWKVYNEVEIPEESPADYSSSEDEAEEVVDDPVDVAAAYLYMIQQQQQQ